MDVGCGVLDNTTIIRVQATLRGLNGTTKRLSDEVLFERTFRAVSSVLEDLKEAVQSRIPRATGNTADGIYTDLTGSSIRDLNGIVASPDAHFEVLEYGRTPGARMPPEAPIREWAEAIGLDLDERGALFKIRRAIGKRGLPALHIMRNAVEERKQHFPIVFMRVFLDNWFSGSNE